MKASRWLAVCLMVAFLAACTRGSGPEQAGKAAPTGHVEVIGGDEDALRNFIGQYLSANPNDLTVLIGEPPNDLPFVLDLPDQSEVAGSVTTIYEDDLRSWDIFFLTDKSREEVDDFYEQTLSDEVWAHPQGWQGGGFVPFETYYLPYCHLKAPYFLSIATTTIESGQTQTAIYVSETAYEPGCNEDTGVPHSPSPDLFSLLPALRPPAGVDQRQGDAGGASSSFGPNAFLSAYQSTILNGSSTTGEIADTYYAQLEEAGWERVRDGRAEDAAWSLWTFADEEGKVWNGEFFIMRTAASDEWQAWIVIKWEAEQD